MMLSGSKGANNAGIFKWASRGESSLTSALLKDGPSEIELSNYGRVPSTGSESPTGLLNGERIHVEPIADLDLFFERLYSYYCDRGLWYIIMRWILELLNIAFTICFSAFFLLYVDWNALFNAKCRMDAVETGKPCDLVKEAIHKHPFSHITLPKAIIIGYLCIFSVYWIFCFLRFFAQLRDILGIRHFYCNSLHIADNEMRTMAWATILEKVVELQNSQQLCVAKDLSAHDVIMRLMRKENYLIGMVNKGVLAFPIHKWVPGAGPVVKCDPAGRQYRLTLTQSLGWALNWCILQSMFDRNYCVRTDFLSNPKALKKRLMVVGIVMLLLSPFIVIFTLVYLFLRYADQFYHHPSIALSRRWSTLSRWMFREYNEVEHLFRHRMNNSVAHASEYLKQFPSLSISLLARFSLTVFGGFAAILIIIAFIDESALEGHFLGRNLFWYGAVFGAVTAISRAAADEAIVVQDPEVSMSMVFERTHYFPKRWRRKESTTSVRAEFETLFQYTGMMFLEEMVSIFLTPFLLVFVVPERVDDILQFIADFTVHVEGVGHVCSFSVFDFQKHGSSKYGSQYSVPRAQRSSQGKMEKSFMSFYGSYPSWEPNSEGNQVLSNLATLREQLWASQISSHVTWSHEMWQVRNNLAGYRERNGLLRRGPLRRNSITGNHSELVRLDENQRNYLYLLDQYYTNPPHNLDNYSPDVPEPRSDFTEQQPRDYWMPPNYGQGGGRFEDIWKGCDMDRSETHLEASTSTPILRESIFQHHDMNNADHAARSQWWARNTRPREASQASFMEPPDFNRYALNIHFDNVSERSTEERQELHWSRSRHMSRTAYIDDSETGELDLHFGDVYSGTPRTPRSGRTN